MQPHSSVAPFALLLLLGQQTVQEDPGEAARRAKAEPAALEALRGALREAGVLVDLEKGRVEIEAAINLPRMPIEYLLAGPSGALHEALLVTECRPRLFTAAFYLLGLERGRNVEYRERTPPPTDEEMRAGISPYEIVPPEGDGVFVYVEWRDGEELRQYRAEDLVVNARTGRSLGRARWIFLGSRFVRVTRDGPESFAADHDQNLLAVNYFSLGNQVLTYPLPEAADQNVFYANEPLLPDPGAKVRVVFARERIERAWSSEG